MTPLLIFMLVGSLFVQPAGSLKCYTCLNQINHAKCQGVMVCNGNASACRTHMLSVFFFDFLSKGCSLSCKVTFTDYIVAKRNVSCCNTDLCNRSSAGSFRMSYAKVTWAAGASLTMAFLRGGP
ncbi:prostate stem cell antigen-like [Heteronotia binoei]|uniref:prostate stem cell antigen-like n=1 Tax=Heteronotia binoei TaxID=13085 RepID=UPI00292EC953|nr:prostate stem cell antigen-like [Heteronotia binoei]